MAAFLHSPGRTDNAPQGIIGIYKFAETPKHVYELFPNEQMPKNSTKQIKQSIFSKQFAKDINMSIIKTNNHTFEIKDTYKHLQNNVSDKNDISIRA